MNVRIRITVPARVSSRVLMCKIARVRTTTTSKMPELRFVGHPPDQCCTTKKLTRVLSKENITMVIVCSAWSADRSWRLWEQKNSTMKLRSREYTIVYSKGAGSADRAKNAHISVKISNEYRSS